MKLPRIAVALLLVASVAGGPSRSAEAALPPGLAGTLSIIPGLGQVTNGDVLEGLVWFGVVIPTWLVAKGPYFPLVGQNLWFYNMYDAFRDAKARDTSKENVFQNYIGAFNPLNIWDPASGLVLGYAGLAAAVNDHPRQNVSTWRLLVSPPLFAFVGLGEEGLFRGFMYPGFSHLLGGSKVVGAVVSSAIFSAAHMLSGLAADASVAALTLRFALGLAFCWQTTYNKYDLRKSIFAHAWYDVIIDYAQLGVLRVEPIRATTPRYAVRVGFPLPL